MPERTAAGHSGTLLPEHEDPGQIKYKQCRSGYGFFVSFVMRFVPILYTGSPICVKNLVFLT